MGDMPYNVSRSYAPTAKVIYLHDFHGVFFTHGQE
jgi:hypothetical protein